MKPRPMYADPINPPREYPNAETSEYKKVSEHDTTGYGVQGRVVTGVGGTGQRQDGMTAIGGLIRPLLCLLYPLLNMLDQAVCA